MATEYPKLPGDYALKFTSSYDQTQQPYRLFIPSAVTTGKALPIAVVLHGKWVNQDAWFDYTPVKKYAEQWGYVVVAPLGRNNVFYKGPGEQDVMDALAEARSHFAIDSNRIYLMGHSMGGWGTWWVGLRHPEVFASIVPMSGFPPMELLPNAKYLSPLIFHDNKDETVPVENSRTPAKELEKLGFEHAYIETSGYGHNSQVIGDYFPVIFEWFARHPRKYQDFTKTERSCPVAADTVIAQWNPAYTKESSLTVLTKFASQLILEETKADYILVKEDMFQWPYGPLTADKIIDMYVFPYEQLGLFTVESAKFVDTAKLMQKDFPLLVTTSYPQAPDWSSDKKVVFIAPLPIAQRYATDIQILPDPAAHYLVRAIQRHGQFPPR